NLHPLNCKKTAPMPHPYNVPFENIYLLNHLPFPPGQWSYLPPQSDTGDGVSVSSYAHRKVAPGTQALAWILQKMAYISALNESPVHHSYHSNSHHRSALFQSLYILHPCSKMFYYHHGILHLYNPLVAVRSPVNPDTYYFLSSQTPHPVVIRTENCP